MILNTICINIYTCRDLSIIYLGVISQIYIEIKIKLADCNNFNSTYCLEGEFNDRNHYITESIYLATIDGFDICRVTI